MSKSSILVADDDPLLIALIRFKLEARGHDVMTAGDGEEALALMATRRPDLVVLDAMMPGTDGFDVLRQMRERPTLREVPVIMLTARKQETDIVGALQLGASDYVVKPFIPEELVMRIARLLSASPNASAVA